MRCVRSSCLRPGTGSSSSTCVPTAARDGRLCACERLCLCLQGTIYNSHWILNPEVLGTDGNLKAARSPLSCIPVTHRLIAEPCLSFSLKLLYI